jgi:hypothetical protein
LLARFRIAARLLCSQWRGHHEQSGD